MIHWKIIKYNRKDDKIGAVASYVDHPDAGISRIGHFTTNQKIFCFKYAIQFTKFNGIRECQHLYSTFLAEKMQ